MQSYEQVKYRYSSLINIFFYLDTQRFISRVYILFIVDMSSRNGIGNYMVTLWVLIKYKKVGCSLQGFRVQCEMWGTSIQYITV